MKSLVFAPIIPIALWVALAVVAAGLLAWYALSLCGRMHRRRYAAVLGLMASAVVLPLAILLNPQWLERIPPPAGKPLLTVLVDVSASMTTQDGADGRARFDEAREIAARAARELSADYDVRIKPFAAETSLADPGDLGSQPLEGQVTDLSRAIQEGLDGDRPQGQALLLLSDGIHNAASGARSVLEQVARAKALAAPIYVKTLGGDASVRDLEVLLRSPQELAFVGQKVPVAVLLHQQGLAGAGITARLLRDGEEVSGQRRQLTLGPDAQTEIVFEVAPNKPGLYRYEVAADALAGEVTAANNTATLLVRVVDEPIRVLLLEGKPYWDTKFLIRTLASDPSIELVSVVQMAEGRLLERTLSRRKEGPPPTATSKAPLDISTAKGVTPSPPPSKEPGAKPALESADPAALVQRVEQWKIRSDPAEILGAAGALGRFQIIVLGRDAELYLTDAAIIQLKRWLAHDGGSLVCHRGATATQIKQQLASLLPVRWMPGRETRFRVRLTERGSNLHWLPADRAGSDVLPQMPTLATVMQTDRLAPLAEVLAMAEGRGGEEAQPVVSYQPLGSGRTVVVEGAGMWRWAFLAPKFQEHEQVYGSLWHSLIRWLVANAGLLPNQQLLLRPDKASFSTTEPSTATMLTRQELAAGEVPLVELSGGDLKGPKQFTPASSGDEPGAYRVVFGKLAEGRYEARVQGRPADEAASRTVFDVRRNLTEQLNLAAQARPDGPHRRGERRRGVDGGRAGGDRPAIRRSSGAAARCAWSGPRPGTAGGSWRACCCCGAARGGCAVPADWCRVRNHCGLNEGKGQWRGQRFGTLISANKR